MSGGLLDYLGLLEKDGVYADPVQVTKIGRVLKNGNSGGVATSLIVATQPSLVFGFTVSSVAAQFIQLFDAKSLPADAAVPTLSFPVGATSTIANAWIPPRTFRQGVVICASSTQHTKTIAAAADTIFDVQYL